MMLRISRCFFFVLRGRERMREREMWYNGFGVRTIFILEDVLILASTF